MAEKSDPPKKQKQEKRGYVENRFVKTRKVIPLWVTSHRLRFILKQVSGPALVVRDHIILPLQWTPMHCISYPNFLSNQPLIALVIQIIFMEASEPTCPPKKNRSRKSGFFGVGRQPRTRIVRIFTYLGVFAQWFFALTFSNIFDPTIWHTSGSATPSIYQIVRWVGMEQQRSG